MKIKFAQHDVEWIYKVLRKESVKWSGRKECLKNARKKVREGTTRDGKPKYKYHWKCAKCQKWYRNEMELEVDHIEEIGGVTSFNGDWNEMLDRLFPRPIKKRMQALCISCHMRKTNLYNSARSKWKRKRP